MRVSRRSLVAALLLVVLCVCALTPSVVGLDTTVKPTVKVGDKFIDNVNSGQETHQFETHVSRLMNIIVNSLYKAKEVFLRELISNGADALDKIRFISLTNATALDSKTKLEIYVKADKAQQVLVIRDSGVGMTKKHLRDALGTIAKVCTYTLEQSGSLLSLIDGGTPVESKRTKSYSPKNSISTVGHVRISRRT